MRSIQRAYDSKYAIQTKPNCNIKLVVRFENLILLNAEPFGLIEVASAEIKIQSVE